MSDRVPERVAFRSVDDEIALFAATTGAYRGLDATAAAGWTVVAGGDLAAIDGLCASFRGRTTDRLKPERREAERTAALREQVIVREEGRQPHPSSPPCCR